MKIVHTIDPVYDTHAKILILGTFPSPKSREVGFYYGHPQNRFWRVMADVFCEERPETKEQKINFLLRNGIALWDVLHECEITGADDSSIRHPAPNDLSRILTVADIRTIFTTGKKATSLYQKYCFPDTGIASVYLPSTSPANCGLSYDGLLAQYKNLIRS